MKLYIKEKVLCINKKYIVSYKKGKLYVRDFTNNKKIIKKIKIGPIIDRIKILGRIKRAEPRCATMLTEDSCIFAHNGIILNYNIKDNICKEEHKFSRKMKNPLYFCTRYDEKGNKEIYYGEYTQNKNKGPVAIYRRKQGIWEKIYEFESNKITHIHNIVYDNYRKNFLILTGDLDYESGIWIANENFSNVKPLMIGKQLYRSCVAFPTKNGFLYATDTPLEDNWIIEVVLEGENIKSINKLFNISGSCIFGSKFEEKFLFSTAVESDSTLGKIRYKFTYKLGNGIKDRFSHLIMLDEKMQKKELLKEKKDILPFYFFQFGNIQFPSNETKKMLITTQALKCGHGNTYEINWSEENGAPVR